MKYLIAIKQIFVYFNKHLYSCMCQVLVQGLDSPTDLQGLLLLLVYIV